MNGVDPLIETVAIDDENISEGGDCMEQTISIQSPTQGALSGEKVMLSRGNVQSCKCTRLLNR